MFIVISTFAPDGRRPGRAAKDQGLANRIAPNGCRPTTLRLASARRNVAEAEREKRGAKPEEP
jgi:hypothetical protein